VEQAGGNGFMSVAATHAALLLAQGVGRLIRRSSDRGVVAVLDSRLATATYRWDLVRSLPPMRRTRHREEAEAFLRSLH
jgi:ATP-dependent DNA helicase DinG